MAQTATAPEIPVPRLKVQYSTELRQRLRQELGLQNIMQVPRPVKIVINMGVGDAIRESRQLDGAVRDLTAITGQKPQVTKAKQSIAGFKIREGQSIGAKVTLRGDRMWEFLEQLVFPEVDYDSIVKVRGMDITVVTTAETNEQGRALLTALGFPFRPGG